MTHLVYDGVRLSPREMDIAGAIVSAATLVLCKKYGVPESTLAPVTNKCFELLVYKTDATDAEIAFAHEIHDLLMAAP